MLLTDHSNNSYFVLTLMSSMPSATLWKSRQAGVNKQALTVLMGSHMPKNALLNLLSISSHRLCKREPMNLAGVAEIGGIPFFSCPSGLNLARSVNLPSGYRKIFLKVFASRVSWPKFFVKERTQIGKFI